ncbi:MAG: hypothetical protein JST96_15770 [Bacteroidetes bacterium]|nr:hypothetical protein [Bacteroidota bacterium]
MSNIKKMVLYNWHLVRILRLVLGIFIGVNAIMIHDMLSGLLSGIFLFQAFTNTGCCCAGSCAIPPSKNKQEKEPVFEEIKND